MTALSGSAPAKHMRQSRKVRAPTGMVVGNAHRERSQGKCHRKHTASFRKPGGGKGEKVGFASSELNVRAHRPDGDAGGTVNPTRSKAE